MFLRICLSDIPRDLIREGNNGKKYISLSVGELKSPDEHGNDHYVSVYVPKNSRGADDKPIFIGRGELRKEDGNSRPAYTDGKTARTYSGYKAEDNKKVDPNADLPF